MKKYLFTIDFEDETGQDGQIVQGFQSERDTLEVIKNCIDEPVNMVSSLLGKKLYIKSILVQQVK